MTRFDEVARLRELAIRAKKVERIKEEKVLSVDTEYVIENYLSSFWILEALACFQPGDAEALDSVLEFDACGCDDPYCARKADALHRLQKAAKILEGME